MESFKYSDLYRDFLNKRESLKDYIFYDDVTDVVSRLKPPKIDRHILCDILEKQNRAFNSKPETFRTIEKLRQDDALTIFAGQQPGLFGGPLLTLYKAVGIVKKSVLLQSRIGRPVVPIFWIACDDHDFEEVNHTWNIGRDGSAKKIEYISAAQHAVPVAEICLDYEAGYNDLVERTKEVFGSTDFTDEIYSRLFAAYKRDGNFVQAFARCLTDILPDFGLILFCPYNKDIKTISKSFFKRLAEGHFRTKEILRGTEDSLKKDGYHIQAEKKESAVHLFYHDPERTAIHMEEESFLVGGKKLSLTALLDLIDKFPEKFSPDVLTRPIWQSYLFPVVAQSGGPSEIAYFCQIGKIFESFNLVQPYILPRPSLTLIEQRQQELMESNGINLEDLTGDIEVIVNKILADTFPEEIDKKFSEFKGKLKADFDDLNCLILDSYNNMEPMTKQTYGKVDGALGHLEKKVHAQHKKNNDVRRNQIYKLAAILYPNKSLQERTVNINHFISKYGYGLVDFIIEKMDADKVEHQLIYLSEYNS